jgi:hypothetical protein
MAAGAGDTRCEFHFGRGEAFRVHLLLLNPAKLGPVGTLMMLLENVRAAVRFAWAVKWGVVTPLVLFLIAVVFLQNSAAARGFVLRATDLSVGVKTTITVVPPALLILAAAWAAAVRRRGEVSSTALATTLVGAALAALLAWGAWLSTQTIAHGNRLVQVDERLIAAEERTGHRFEVLRQEIVSAGKDTTEGIAKLQEVTELKLKYLADKLAEQRRE